MDTPNSRSPSEHWQAIERRLWNALLGWPAFIIPAALALVAVSTGACGDDEPQARTANALWITGHARITNGTELPDEETAFFVRVRPRNAPSGCELTVGPKHISLDPDGGYSVVVNANDLRASDSDPGCDIDRFATDSLASVEVDARLDPSSALCTDFCATSPESECASECTKNDARIGATHVFGADLIERADVNESDALVLRADLTFDSLTEPFPSDGGAPRPDNDDDDHGDDDHTDDDHSPPPPPPGDDDGDDDDDDGPPPNTGLPDFTLDRSATASSLRFSRRIFTSSSCAMVEGCVTGTGERKLLRFDAVIVNRGRGDFFLGSPQDNSDFAYSSCHGHYHLQSIAEYRLLAKDGSTVAVSRKQGFCMMDTRRYSGSGPARYTCTFQGLSAGWADVYDSSLDCQWLDITEVPKGEYRLQLTVNPGGHYKETNQSNNTISMEVQIP